MEYSKEFIEMLEKAEKAGLYVGTGKPDAKILIIGKELAIDREENREQAKQEIATNIFKWKKNIENHTTQQDIPDWDGKLENLNPLYLYRHSKQKEGHTWNKYQKLMDYIRDVPHTEETNFQEFAFLTEYNQNPSKNSALQETTEQRESIKERDEFFRSTPFFQQFPIVIVAAGDYGGKNFDVHLVDTFKVEWKGLFEVREEGVFQIEPGTKVYKGQWFSLHYSPNKLVIHTRQLSMDVSNSLLENIAAKVREFIEEKGIKLQ